MKRYFILLCLFILFLGIERTFAEILDFEHLSLDYESYWNGSDSAGGFFVGDIFFTNNYDKEFASWDGFSYSNISNTQVKYPERLLEYQFNAITGEGAGKSSNYLVCYFNTLEDYRPTIILPEQQQVIGAYFTNNIYAYYAMLDGFYIARKFKEDDWFKVIITGKDETGNVTGSIDIYLAEGRDILDTWRWEDLSRLGRVKSIEFIIDSSDKDILLGINTPAYFCMDNLEFLSLDINNTNEISYNDSNLSTGMFPNDPNIFGNLSTLEPEYILDAPAQDTNIMEALIFKGHNDMESVCYISCLNIKHKSPKLP